MHALCLETPHTLQNELKGGKGGGSSDGSDNTKVCVKLCKSVIVIRHLTPLKQPHLLGTEGWPK